MRDYNDEVWQSFLRSVNPATVEGERFGIPGPDERPGSAGDLRMRREHERSKRPVVPESRGSLSELAVHEAVAEWAAYKPAPTYKPRKKPTSSTPTVIPADRLLQIAVEAAGRKKAS